MLHSSGSPFPSLSLPTTFGMRSYIKVKSSQINKISYLKFLVEAGLFIKIIEKLFKIIIMEYLMNSAAL